MKYLFSTLLGLLFGIGIMHMIVPYRPDIISKEYAAELVRNHILCYQGRVVDQLMLDSVFINIDSVNLKYQVSCGIRIDSILNGELE